uniref:Uncharacterized protein n=1 Tax=Oryza barthii TaxID=65489 RepID=A0A0D3EN28_9ORYZ
MAFRWLHAGDDDCGGSDNLMAFERLHAGDETMLSLCPTLCASIAGHLAHLLHPVGRLIDGSDRQAYYTKTLSQPFAGRRRLASYPSWPLHFRALASSSPLWCWRSTSEDWGFNSGWLLNIEGHWVSDSIASLGCLVARSVTIWCQLYFSNFYSLIFYADASQIGKWCVFKII